jgi:hypothetical protein
MVLAGSELPLAWIGEAMFEVRLLVIVSESELGRHRENKQEWIHAGCYLVVVRSVLFFGG